MAGVFGPGGLDVAGDRNARRLPRLAGGDRGVGVDVIDVHEPRRRPEVRREVGRAQRHLDGPVPEHDPLALARRGALQAMRCHPFGHQDHGERVRRRPEHRAADVDAAGRQRLANELAVVIG